MPASYDLLKVQAIEFNDQIRRSAYSFEIVNNQLKLFPVPTESGSLFIEYYKRSDKDTVLDNESTALVTTVSEVPFSNPTYGHINSVGRDWIFRYTLALSKEVLAYIRGKYQSVPVPGSEASLNQADLLTDARAEKESLLTNLREMLDQTSKVRALEQKAQESQFIRQTLTDVPVKIYIG